MKNNPPKVSIVLPTYNGSKYIRRSIDSCLEQSYRDIELVIVDDASTDDTPGIIASYSDKRIVLIRNKSNLRLPKALNAGFARASGDYLTWTSDDNFYCPDAVERMVGFLSKEQRQFVYCDYFLFREGSEQKIRHIRIPDAATFRDTNFVRACFMYSRKVKDVIGDYDPQTELSEDYDYWIRVSKKFNLYHLKEPLYYYRLHSQALYSRRFWEQEITKCLVRFKHNLFLEEECVRFFARLWIKKRNLPLGSFFYPFVLYFFSRPLTGILAAFKYEGAGFPECKEQISRKVL